MTAGSLQYKPSRHLGPEEQSLGMDSSSQESWEAGRGLTYLLTKWGWAPSFQQANSV